MALKNVMRFNGQVLRAISVLYEAHPVCVRLDVRDLFSVAERMSSDGIDEKFAAGTLKWLKDNEYVRGEFLSAVGKLDGAQLTAHTWRVLQSTELSSRVQSLGESLKQAISVGGPYFDGVSELLISRLIAK